MNKLRPRHHRRVDPGIVLDCARKGKEEAPPQFGSGERNETGCSLALKNSTEKGRILILSVLLCLIMRGCPNCFGGMNADAAGVVRVAEVVGFAQSRRSKFIDCRQNFGATFSRSGGGGGAKQREFLRPSRSTPATLIAAHCCHSSRTSAALSFQFNSCFSAEYISNLSNDFLGIDFSHPSLFNEYKIWCS